MRKKYRHEYKFLCSLQDAVLIEHRLQGLMKVDRNVGAQGFYNIRSIYFDDYYNTCVMKNEDGVGRRAKYRIRIYEHSGERIMLEKKIKEKGKIRKLSTPLTKEQFDAIVYDKGLPLHSEEAERYTSLLQQFLVLQQTRGFRKQVIVSYDRTPYVYREGNVRITIDKNISASVDYLHFFDKNLAKRPILPMGQCLLEVKYDEILPEFIRASMETGRLLRTTFSKYYLCYKAISR